MASKRLGEFLKEQQQPFVLEAYLSERGYSTPNINRRDSTNKKKKKKALFPFSKILTALHKKLAFQNKSRTTTVIVNNSSDTRNKHANVGVSVPQSLDQTIVETDRFSTASSSTLFNSCSDIDEDDTNSLSSHNNPLFFSDTADQSQQDTSHGKCCQRSLEVCVTHGTLNKYVSVWGIEQRIDSCGGEEDYSVLSAALWSSIIVGHEHDVFKSKKVLRMHKTKQQQQQQLLFDCVKEITINVPRKGDDDTQKGCKKIMGLEKMGKIIWEKKTKEWSQHETNLDSMNEWSSNLLKEQVKDISVEIADAILQQVNDEMVSEMIEFEIS